MTDELDHKSDGENPSLLSIQHLISDYFPAIVYIYDTDKRKLSYISKKVTDLLGYTLEDIKTWDDDWMNMVFKDDLESVQKEVEKFNILQNQETHSFNCRYNNKGDGWKYFRTQGSVLHRSDDGKPSSFLFIAQDITDQLKSAEELKKSRELMKDVEQMLEFGTWDWDFSNNSIERSDGIYTLLGYDDSIIEKVRGLNMQEQHDFYMDHVMPEDRERVDYVIKTAIEENKDYEVGYRIKSTSGEEKIIFSKAKAVKGEQDALSKFLGVTSDVTKATRYRREIESYVAELNRSNKELEEFAYVASHDLQEPLRKIITFSDRLQTKFGALLGTEGAAYLSRMTIATENMRILIDNLLEFSRISRSKEAFTLTDLNVLMDDAKSELELKIEDTGALISQQLLPSIVCNGPQIKQLFVNLLSNSLKFRKPDSETFIEIGCEAVSHLERARENLSALMEYYKISITDNGIGFDKEYADRIFLIFQRLHGKSEYPGSGIGLAICKKILDQHDGIIKADSTPDRGSVFTVFLPVHHP